MLKRERQSVGPSRGEVAVVVADDDGLPDVLHP